MATKKTNAKKSTEAKPARQWQKTVAHVVEAALEAAAGHGTTIAAIVKKTGLKESAVERHVRYMANKLDGYSIKNPRATFNASTGACKLTENGTGHFRSDAWLEEARARFAGAKKKPAKRAAKK